MAGLDGIKIDLTANQKQVLMAEKAGDEFKNKPSNQTQEEYFNKKPLIDNPITEINKPPMPLLDIIDDCGLTPEKIELIRNDAGLPGVWNFLLDFQDSINLASPTVKNAFDDIKIADHITTQQRADITAFGKKPNPVRKIKGQSRNQELLGLDVVVGKGDLK